VSEDYRGWDVTASTPRGKSEWLEEAHGRLERPRRVHHQILPKAIDIHGDIGIIYYLYSALFRSDEGTYSLSKGQWTDVFRKVDGRWLLIADAGGETTSHTNILVSAEWLDRRRGEPNMVLLQVESRADRFTDGHIPGALHLPYDRIAWDGEYGEGAELLPVEEIASALEELGISDRDRIVVYSSQPLLGTRLWFTLDLMGVGQGVSLLDGGLAAWTNEGRPLSTEVGAAPKPTSLTLQPKLDLIVDADWVLENGEAEGVALVDARYRPEYTGEDQEGERVGHIPGAGNAVWSEMVESPELFRFKPVDELAANLAAAGVDPGETVVSYCVVGLRASLDYFVARLLGYDALLYDGSFRDWIRRELPLVEGGG
jgi:thiosulfate/3-mercaptopyruvate sulfurtransferase